MKNIAKKLVVAKLGYQLRKLQKKNNFKIIGVVGSIGKTSTKMAIAQTLAVGLRTRYQEGNYNDIVSVPLIFFGEEMPGLFNPIAWFKLFRRNQKQLKKPYPYDVVVVELGSDGPGQIEQFKQYLSLEIAVVTAITPEHMLNFDGLGAVANEELAVSGFSNLVLANKDLCGGEYLKTVPELLTYGVKELADYGPGEIDAIAKGKSEAEQYSLIAAAAVAQKLGMRPADINKGLASFSPFAGRMRELKGTNGSTIIDDTYNSSPDAVKLALDYLYGLKSTQKIAVLGNMNEMGDYSQKAHTEVGNYCDSKQLSLVVTIGPDANKYLAAAAGAKGCKVQTFDSPYAAGEYLKPIIEKNAAILVKGSQNGVFAEETVKLLLANPNDSKKLVRQSKQWLKIKQKAFK